MRKSNLVTRANIYETIDSPIKILNRLISSSTSRLETCLDSATLEPFLSNSTKPISCSSQQLANWRLEPNSNQQQPSTSRRRHLNATPLTTQTEASNQTSTTNHYSEIHSTPVSPADQLEAGHYQVPASVFSQPNVEDQISHLIEHKRKKTLLLLRSKEAPRASIEQTVDDLPICNEEDELTTDSARPNTCSPTNISEYENLNVGRLDDDDRAVYNSQQVGQAEIDVISPSESQNFNTLSIVSDILGDLSQEENSLVQQLSRG